MTGVGVRVRSGTGDAEGAEVEDGLGLTTSQTILSLSRSSLAFSLNTEAETLGVKIGPAPRLTVFTESDIPYL